MIQALTVTFPSRCNRWPKTYKTWKNTRKKVSMIKINPLSFQRFVTSTTSQGKNRFIHTSKNKTQIVCYALKGLIRCTYKTPNKTQHYTIAFPSGSQTVTQPGPRSARTTKERSQNSFLTCSSRWFSLTRRSTSISTARDQLVHTGALQTTWVLTQMSSKLRIYS